MKIVSNSTTAASHPRPVTFRLPRNGSVDPYFGGSRTFWNQRVLPNPGNNFKPPIRSISVKEQGAKRGIRFIFFDSAKNFFDALAANMPQEAHQ